VCPATAPTRSGCFLGCFPLSQGESPSEARPWQARKCTRSANTRIHRRTRYRRLGEVRGCVDRPDAAERDPASALAHQKSTRVAVTKNDRKTCRGRKRANQPRHSLEERVHGVRRRFVRRAWRSVPKIGPRMNASDHFRTSGLTITPLRVAWKTRCSSLYCGRTILPFALRYLFA
jgi:hypothetical protein